MTDITVYSTPTCPYCKMVKEFLNEKGVEFKEIDVSTDRDAVKTIVEKSGQMGVPQIEINDKIIVGFNKEALERELESE